jgi:hypothetical protein
VKAAIPEPAYRGKKKRAASGTTSVPIGGPAQRLQAGAHPTPTLDFFRAISAGGCLVVCISTVALCGAKPSTH